MRDLLYLCHRIPYPPIKGDKIRAWHFFQHLTQNFRVHLGCFVDDPEDWKYQAFLEGICASVCCVPLDKRRQRIRSLLRLRPGRPLTLDYFGSARLASWVEGVCVRCDPEFAFVFSSGMAEYVIDRKDTRLILDMVDIDSEKFAEYGIRAGWPARLVWGREGRTLFDFERRAANTFEQTLFVSDAEASRFTTLAPETRGRVGFIENGVDLDYFAPAPRATEPLPVGPRNLVFTGTMDYWPNVDAMTYFAADVMPLLRASGVAVHLTIVGANPDPAVTALAGSDITVTGRVDDVRPYIAQSDVVVAPLRIARGIQNKVLEAMAMSRPVVASREAFEGIRATAGNDILVADGASEIAGSILGVLGGRHPALGAAGRAAMERGYGWPAMLRRLDRIMMDQRAPVPAQ